ncbi:LysR family transcriptional regulator [Paenibacillus pectinilyticus]|uniref:LysR family transcriptional regulator n=1 Tax=Paenibacillus pectinilyticus TaxID=512399 RepID=A0A1C1A3B2_9BACL|nr:LysR family transcriptional regulator [Paenibacillus pectinilyticus]OCT15036.1 LysR family transcriptional regulator [Paenibacillus pectinilyticus]
MELLQLQYFQTTAKLEQITKAANELNITQPSLSKTIARLEEDIGVPLFDRLGRNIRLNAYGKVLLKRVEHIFQELEEAQREIQDMAGLHHGIIKLAVSLTNLLPEILGDFLEHYPSVHLRQVVEPTSVMKQMLENGDIDMCITYAQIEGPDIEWKALRTEELHLLVPDQHPLSARESVSLKELQHESFIGLRSDFWFRNMTDKLCMKIAGFTPHTNIEVDEVDAILLLLKKGHGITFAPDLAWRSRMNLKQNKLRITDLDENMTLGLAWSRNHYLSFAAQKFHEFVLDYFDKSRA